MEDDKIEKYKYKMPDDTNLDYFLEHADEMIEDTEHVLDSWWISGLKKKAFRTKYEDYVNWKLKLWDKAHAEHNYAITMGGLFFVIPGEFEDQELYRLEHDYCAATGRWDFFVWEDIPEEQRKWYLEE